MTAETKSYLLTHTHVDASRFKRARCYIVELLRDLKAPRGLVQLIKYAAVGISNTLIDTGTYFALTRWLWLASLPVLAKGIAYTVGMINSFYWNRSWTFRSSSNPCRAAFLFTLTHIAALGINAGVMYWGLEKLNLNEALTLVLATGGAFGWNFAFNKLVVFKS